MSELAFNLNGEPFELPSAAVGWRVRKMKPKGAPEVVYSRDGVPLILPIDADIDDLRRAARSEGRFRLDPVDEHNRMLANASAGYVCVPASENPAEQAQPASRPQTDNVAIEAMKLNTELARSIIDKFPMMIESAAALLRAADSAGITTRPPRVLADEHVDEEDEDDEDDQDEQDDGLGNEAAPKASGLVGVIETLAPFVMPAIVNAIAGGKLKIPGGLGALLDCRRARPKARSHAEVSASHATSMPGAAPAPGPRDPAPVGGGNVRAHGVAPATARPAGGFARPRTVGVRHGASTASSAMASPAAASPPRPSSLAPSSPTASSTAPVRPASGETPASSTPAGTPVPDPPQPAVFGGPHDMRIAESTAGRGDGASTTAEAPLPHVTHRNEAHPGLDVSEPNDCLWIDSADEDPEVELIDAADGGVTSASAGESAAEAEDELPTLDAATLAHFVAIQGALTFREGMLARALAAELSPAELRTWMTELRQLSVADAAAKIRAVIGDAGADDAAGGGS
jgi:hypothetical protein